MACAETLPAPNDADPDGRERGLGLNPTDASDAAGLKLHRFYTNIEVYINGLAK